ncbi:VirB4-like conjugal transfer ATPase, CD1110 family [Enterococcus sp. DIV1420a]|uniref:VirB4-like conjugal transfer ATPase, CD1110 family n=1 Tax=Enterococcus sp. DIV1420a TaxID=2774672 RepID=UPI003F683AE4
MRKISKKTEKSKKQLPQKRLKQSKLKPPKQKIPAASTQNSLYYTALFEDGLMHVVDQQYSKTYALGAINYTTAHIEQQKNILSQYNKAINSLSEKEQFQLTLLVTKTPKGAYMQRTAYALQNDAGDVLRKELNQILADNYDAGRNNWQVERFITLGTTADNVQSANKQLLNISEAFADELMGIKASFERQDGMERLRILNKILRPGKPLYGNYQDIARSRRTTKDLIAPNLLDFKQPGKIDFQLDEQYGQVLYLRDFPRNLSDKMCKELTEAETQMVITIHAHPYSIAKTTQKLRTEATNIEADVIKQEQKASRNGSSPERIARTIKELHNDVNEQIEFVEETGDKQMASTFLVYVWDESKEALRYQVDKVKAVGEKFGAVFEPLYLTQEQALNASLPLGKNYLDFERVFLRDLITPNISINSPFTSQDVHHQNGTYYGINQLSKNNILINRMGRELKNANGGFLAVSGGGKSFAAKSEIIATMLRNPKAEIIILDIEREYMPLADFLNGEVVTVAPGSDTSINILELADPDAMKVGDDPVAIKSNFLISLITNQLGTISSTQRSIIDEVTIQTFKEYETPTLQEWYDVLSRDTSGAAQELLEGLRLYVKGSLNMFAKATNVNANSNLTIYDMYLLKNEMKTFGYLAILDRVWNKVVENRAKGIETYVYIDEFQVIINPNQPTILRAQAAEIYARIRKYRGCPTFMTQSAETMLSTLEGRSILFNSDFLVLLEQKGEVLEALVERFKLTEKQAMYLENTKVGTGLIIAGGQVIPFSNLIPQNTKLFELMDTSYED